jgi:hypothetical protein
MIPPQQPVKNPPPFGHPLFKGNCRHSSFLKEVPRNEAEDLLNLVKPNVSEMNLSFTGMLRGNHLVQLFNGMSRSEGSRLLTVHLKMEKKGGLVQMLNLEGMVG